MKRMSSPEKVTQTDHDDLTTLYRRQQSYPPPPVARSNSSNSTSRSEPGRYLVPVHSSRETDQFVGGHSFSRMSLTNSTSSNRYNDEMVINNNSSTRSSYSKGFEVPILPHATTNYMMDSQYHKTPISASNSPVVHYLKPTAPVRSISHPTTAREFAIQTAPSVTRESTIGATSLHYNRSRKHSEDFNQQAISVVKPIIPRSRHIPKHRKQKIDMSSNENRLKTYYDYQPSWPHLAISIVTLSSHGLYYTGVEDICQCFECEVRIENWSAYDNSFKRHFIESPNCHFLRVTFLKEIEMICNEVYSAFATVEQRIATFLNWPLSRKLPGFLLAESGWFYTGKDVITQCFKCGFLHDQWKPGDDPLLVHEEKCKECSFCMEKQREHLQQATAVSKEFKVVGIDYSTKDARLQSFSVVCLGKDINKEEFVEAGFYLIEGAIPVLSVKCFSCHLIVSDWSPGDDPYIKHYKLKPDCLYLKEQSIKKPSHKESFNGEDPCRVSSLPDDVYDRRRSPTTSPSSSGVFKSPPANFASHQEEKEEDGKYCTVCLCNKKQYAIVPCGHLCVCSECSVMLTHCPLCRGTKQGVLRIYDS